MHVICVVWQQRRQRVVAVFAIGEAWQFKGWKWAEPVELFQHGKFAFIPSGDRTAIFTGMYNCMPVLGLHAMFDVDPLRPTVASWNVRVVKVFTQVHFQVV